MACRRIFFGKVQFNFLLLWRIKLTQESLRVPKGNDYDRLPVIESYDYLRSIHVPHGIFFNSKVMSAQVDRFSHFSDESESYGDQTTGMPFYDHSGSPSSPISPVSSTPSSVVPSPRYHHALPPPFSREGNQLITLPPITSLRPVTHQSRSQRGGSAPQNYVPLSSEDRRVLDSFRVVL